MKLRGKRHWLHCTQDHHGESWTFDLRRPRLMGTDEPPTPRLCVAPTVPRCIVGALPGRRGRPLYVYRTQTPRHGLYPGTKRVHDCWLTSEHWLVTPTTLTLDRVIPPEVAELYADYVRAALRANAMTPMSCAQKAHAFLYAVDCISLVELIDHLDTRMARAIRRVFPIHS